METLTRNHLGTFWVWLGTILIRLCALLAFIPAILFFFQIPISAGYFPAIGLGLLVWAALEGRRLFPNSRRMVSGGLVLILSVVVVSLLVSGWFLDQSYDGRHYHFFAIQLLKEGWNPVFDPRIPAPGYHQGWMDWARFYPKATWYAGATLYATLGSSEAAKAPALLLIFSVFGIVLGNLLKFSRLRTWQAVAISLILAFNPVQVTQALSKYVDGQLSACLTIAWVALIALRWSSDYFNLLALGAVILYGSSIKSTGIFYFAIFVFFGLLPFLLKPRRWRRLGVVAGTAAAAVVLSIFVIGYNPYVTNTLLYRNPLHPATLQNQEAMMGANRPQDFKDLDRFTRFARSILGPSSDPYLENASPDPKIPFTLLEQELDVFITPDVRVGGFGPWFSGALLVALVGWLILVLTRPAMAGRVAYWMIPILISTFLSGEGWWARYAPQIWILPALVCAGIWQAPGAAPGLSRLAAGLALILLINLGMVTWSNVQFNFAQTVATRQEFETLLSQGQPLWMYCPVFCETMRVNFQERGIVYREVDGREQLPCPRPFFGVYVSALSCPP